MDIVKQHLNNLMSIKGRIPLVQLIVTENSKRIVDFVGKLSIDHQLYMVHMVMEKSCLSMRFEHSQVRLIKVYGGPFPLIEIDTTTVEDEDDDE